MGKIEEFKILYWKWTSYMLLGVEEGFASLGLNVDTFFYPLTKETWNQEEKFQKELKTQLEKKSYSLVFSINFNPMISDLCQEKSIPYVCWIYDSPPNILDLGKLKHPVNRIFYFDRGQKEAYESLGYPGFHLPLAADVSSFQACIQKNQKRKQEYEAEISMVGSLYETEYQYVVSFLDDYHRGYLEGLIQSQASIPQAYLLPYTVTEELMEELNPFYRKASKGKETISQRQMEYLLAQEKTARERFLALRVLSHQHQVCLYSHSEGKGLEGIVKKGPVDYYEEMPLVFAFSEINLNLSLSCIRTGIPLRVMDVLASGGFLLTNDQEELWECFAPGEDLVIYRDLEELLYLVNYYRKRPEERKKIAENGLERVKKEYSFAGQMKKMFSMI